MADDDNNGPSGPGPSVSGSSNYFTHNSNYQNLSTHSVNTVDLSGEATIQVTGRNPKLVCNGADIDLTRLAGFMEIYEWLNKNQLTLPFPDVAKLKNYEILQVQWNEILELFKQYKVTESLLDLPKDKKTDD